MDDKKEAIVGLIAFSIIVLIIYLTLDWFFLIYFSILLLLAAIAIYLFSKKSLISKTGAIILNHDILFKILMPSKYRKQIKEINKQE